MATEMRLPELGEGIESGDLISILIKVGDTIIPEQSLMEFETNKATIDLPSDVSGVVKEIHVQEGTVVFVGTLLLTIEENSSQEASPSKKETVDIKTATAVAIVEKPSIVKRGVLADRKQKIPASPSLRRRSRILGIDLFTVLGTGPGGRITIEDFDRFLLAQGGGGVQAPPLPDFTKWGEVSTKPYKSLRKKTAEHVAMSSQLIPHVTQFDEADVTELEKLRKVNGVAIQEKGGKLTPIVLLLKAVAYCLKEFPQFAASLDEKGGEIIYKKYTHIGIAVDTPKGLMVPVIRDVDTKSIEELAIELFILGGRAKEGKIKVNELQGGVFTISSLGHLGGTYFTPIINYPEVAILGVSKQELKAVVRDGEVVPRLMLPFALSYDHRVIDGVVGVKFTRALASYLEANGPFA
jgi:pyruvate dehydrogenase E2 component (dihydrolipoamide acetyltransferase)